MADTAMNRLVPYETVKPGREAVYSGKPFTEESEDWPLNIRGDSEGNEILEWSLHPWLWPELEEQLKPDISALDAMQSALGPLDDEVRKIRAQTASLVPCDNGLPVTVDELLRAIGDGRLPEKPFHDGCMLCSMWWEDRTTQPGQTESMRVIEEVLKAYLAGEPRDKVVSWHPHAWGFIDRTYGWLGPADNLTTMQRLMLERALLPFEYLAKHVTEREPVHAKCFLPDGRGEELDAQIAAAGMLPPIPINDFGKFMEGYDSIDDPARKDLYRVCGRIACGVCGLSDCHHNTFRIIESWIHGIATGRPDVSSRNRGGERQRIGRLLFGYTLGLDRWLSGASLHFQLLDLGHLDLGFDPKNEISRVYAYLGCRDEARHQGRLELMDWLAGSLWFNLRYNRPAGLERHKDLLKLAEENHLGLRDWMDGLL